MFPQTQMVKTRKAVESLYDGKCTIIEHQKVKKENKSTGFSDITVVKDQPCRLSFSTVKNAEQGETAANLIQVTKLFITPEIKVKPGSKLIITQDGVTTEYKNSGQPAIYKTHQEIVLELFDGWS